MVLVMLKASWPPPPSWLLLHVLVVVAATKVGHSPVVVIAEIRSSSGAAVSDIVHPLSSLKIPVQLSGLERTPRSSVSSVQSLGGDVVVLPCAKNILVARVEAISAVLVTIIVIVPGGETVLWIIPADVVVACNFVVSCVIPASADCSSCCLLPAQLRCIGDHLAVKI